MTEKQIKQIVKETLSELLEHKMIKYGDAIIVDQIGELLKAHYNVPDESISKALQQIQNDEYYGVLEGYYGEGLTLERLSCKFNADISTIQRNKKRLCLKLYKIINC